jgi:hypothetical protein
MPASVKILQRMHKELLGYHRGANRNEYGRAQ